MLVTAKAGHDVAKGTVVDVQRARPGDEARADLQLPMEEGGIDHGRQQVVRRFDGVDVAGEMQVDLLHRHDLGHAASGPTALDAEERTGRRLAQAECDLRADPSQSLGQADRARGDRRNDNQLALGPLLEPFQRVETDLGLVRAVGDELGLQ